MYNDSKNNGIDFSNIKSQVGAASTLARSEFIGAIKNSGSDLQLCHPRQAVLLPGDHTLTAVAPTLTSLFRSRKNGPSLPLHLFFFFFFNS